MGYYIETPGHTHGKAQQIIDVHGAELLSRAPLSVDDVPADKAIICVVDNGPFEAAAFAYNDEELRDFTHPDPRPKQWLLMDRAKACELTGFTVG
ncbi:hypothetical protein LCGC14_1522510 [marine sediment metagenome]|uniref:Uncharacterized protein n=1 Tax=marine sediment metagenome TaxID=412755 RepID=A0A0F9LDW6_9ZZZZ